MFKRTGQRPSIYRSGYVYLHTHKTQINTLKHKHKGTLKHKHTDTLKHKHTDKLKHKHKDTLKHKHTDTIQVCT